MSSTSPLIQLSPPISSPTNSINDIDITDAEPPQNFEDVYTTDTPQHEQAFILPSFENEFFNNFPFEQFLPHGQLGVADFTMQPGHPSWLMPMSEVQLGWESASSEGPAFSSTSSYSTPTTVASENQNRSNRASSIPTNEELQHLLRDVFFSRFHPIFPILHRRTFLDSLEDRKLQLDDDVLLLSILALASTGHHESSISEKGESWLSRARRLVDKAIKSSTASTQHVQAGIWITFTLFLRADMSESWIYLGKTWRMASPLGLHRIDSRKRGHSGGGGNSENARAIEEMRRMMWALFLLDRCLSFLCGWPFAIDDRQFAVNLPTSDKTFQDSNPDLLRDLTPQPFPVSIDKIIGPVDDCYAHICYATVLLGRIVDYNNFPGADDDESEVRRQAFSKLEVALARLLLATPAQYTKITYLQSTQEQENTCWLICLLQTCSILLHHPTVRTAAQQDDPPRDGSNASPEFLRCLAGTKHIISAIKDLVTIANRSFLNPLAAPILFLSGRILIIHWLETKDPCTRSEIDLILLSLDKMKEFCEPLANKYKRLLLFDLSRPSTSIEDIKTNDGTYVGPECSTVMAQ
ncbi:hypothetical protein TWF694_007716 [Orbilia ellipsospora]